MLWVRRKLSVEERLANGHHLCNQVSRHQTNRTNEHNLRWWRIPHPSHVWSSSRKNVAQRLQLSDEEVPHREVVDHKCGILPFGAVKPSLCDAAVTERNRGGVRESVLSVSVLVLVSGFCQRMSADSMSMRYVDVGTSGWTCTDADDREKKEDVCWSKCEVVCDTHVLIRKAIPIFHPTSFLTWILGVYVRFGIIVFILFSSYHFSTYLSFILFIPRQ